MLTSRPVSCLSERCDCQLDSIEPTYTTFVYCTTPSLTPQVLPSATTVDFFGLCIFRIVSSHPIPASFLISHSPYHNSMLCDMTVGGFLLKWQSE